MENQQHSIVLYQADSTNVCVSVCYANETFWLTQKAMAELFGVNVPNISKHLSNIYEEGELRKEATVSKMEIVQ
ncbi:MAG: cell filamentation protein Fic, partial [Bacteroidales bacterium]|nr:cell filamentation protein Fic [Bacteroidales bacterium]